MCTQVYFVLPAGADVSAIDRLTEHHKVGRGLAFAGAEGPSCFPGESGYRVTPWKMCHCGWGARDFARVVSDALEARSALWVGVFVSEAGKGSTDCERLVTTPDEFATAASEEDVVYIVEPPLAPPVVRRHGPRRRRSRPG